MMQYYLPTSLPDNHPQTADEIANAVGIFHAFWLFREGERAYDDYRGLLPLKNAPVLPDNSVLLSDDVVGHLIQYLQWVPTLNPRKHGKSISQNGLNQCGITAIASGGGECFRQICLGWAQILAQGPEPLILRSGWFAVEDGDPPQWKPYHFRISRDRLVADLQQLAEFGEKAATGEYFIMHLGI